VQVDKANNSHLAKLQNPSHTYKAIDRGLLDKHDRQIPHDRAVLMLDKQAAAQQQITLKVCRTFQFYDFLA
jgi:hypothetical protein